MTRFTGLRMIQVVLPTLAAGGGHGFHFIRMRFPKLAFADHDRCVGVEALVRDQEGLRIAALVLGQDRFGGHEALLGIIFVGEKFGDAAGVFGDFYANGRKLFLQEAQPGIVIGQQR